MMSWRWPWSRRDDGAVHEVQQEREDALAETEAARRRLEYARRRAISVQREADRFAIWVEEALRGRG